MGSLRQVQRRQAGGLEVGPPRKVPRRRAGRGWTPASFLLVAGLLAFSLAVSQAMWRKGLVLSGGIEFADYELPDSSPTPSGTPTSTPTPTGSVTPPETPTPEPPAATPTGTETGTPTPTPEITPTEPTGVIYSDPPDDSLQMDDEGNLTGVGLPGHPSDLREVRMMWVTEDGEQFLEIWIFRSKSGHSFSSAVQVFLASGPSGQETLAMVLLWEDHAGQVTRQAQDPQGVEIRDERILIQPLNDGAEVHLRIPADRVSPADRLLICSFDKPVDGELRGFDGTNEYVPIPER